VITRTLLKNITAHGKNDRFLRTLNLAAPSQHRGGGLQAIRYRHP